MSDDIQHTELRGRVISSGAWMFCLRFFQLLSHLVKLIILARLLAPQDFGLLGIALLTMATFDIFSQTGFEEALIQKKGDSTGYLDAAWTFLLFRGLLLFFLVFSCSPAIAGFFEMPEALNVIRAIGAVFIFRGLTNPGIFLFKKDLKFRKFFLYDFSGAICDMVIAVIAVLIYRSIWALVLGILAGECLKCIMSFILHPHRPQLSFNKEKAASLFRFGRWILGAKILIFLITQGDDALVGKVLGATALGFYQVAYRISNLPATEITHIISQVTFPAYSRMQENISALKGAYTKALELTALISFFMAGVIFLTAPEFTSVFLGEKWLPMIPALRLLCLFGLTRSLAATMGPVLYGVGRPEIQTRLSAIQLIFMAIIIYPLTMKWGIAGASLGVLLPNILALIMIFFETKKLINLRGKEFILSIAAPLVSLIVMFLVVFALKNLHLFKSVFVNFFLFVLAAVLCYLTVIYFWDMKTGNRIRKEVAGIFKQLRGNMA